MISQPAVSYGFVKKCLKLITNDNQMIKLEAQGWDALKKRELDV